MARPKTIPAPATVPTTDDLPELRPMLGMNDVLSILGFKSRNSIYELMRAGYLPGIRMGGLLRFNEADVRKLMKTGTATAATAARAAAHTDPLA